MSTSRSLYGLAFGRIMQRPPAVAEVCTESREVAKRQGSMIKLWSGNQRTWFQSDRDFVVDGIYERHFDIDDFSLSRPVTNQLLMTGKHLESWCSDTIYDKANYEQLLHFNGLKKIYVASNIYFVDSTWDPSVVTEIFEGDSIIIVGEGLHGEYSTKLDKFFSRESTRSVLEKVMVPSWDRRDGNKMCDAKLWRLFISRFRTMWDKVRNDMAEKFGIGDTEDETQDEVEDGSDLYFRVPGSELEFIRCCAFIKSDFLLAKGLSWRL